MNEEESKLNVIPRLEKYFNPRYPQLSTTKEIKGGLFAVQLASEKFFDQDASTPRKFFIPCKGQFLFQDQFFIPHQGYLLT